MTSKTRHILSVQSHVVHGYVGNRAATFPLQCLGWDVDALNTVNFSNHTGYGSVRGSKTTAVELNHIYDGLKAIGASYDAFLTGYVPGAEALQAVCAIGHDLKTRTPSALWLLDPVMGDEGHLYVSDSVIPVYRKALHQGGIDIITPNQFEAELLVEFKIEDTDSLRRALETLHHDFKVPNVVISSLSFGRSGQIIAVASRCTQNGQIFTSSFEIPLIESYFTGVGDLFSALLMDRVHRMHVRESALYEEEHVLDEAVAEVLTVMARVLQATSDAAVREVGHAITSRMGSAETMKSCELRLVECRDVYTSTEKAFGAQRL